MSEIKITEKTIVIITPAEMLYISKIFYRFFVSKGIETKVVISSNLNTFLEQNKNNTSSSFIYFIYCIFRIPNYLKGFFKNNYILYQLEQHRNNQLSQHYQNMLTDGSFEYYYNNALIVLDYCQQNIQVLEDFLKIKPNLLEVPIEPLKLVEPVSSKSIDILFMGSINEKRKNILEYLSKKYNVVVINSLFFTQLNDYFNRAKILLNIHYYENAILERVRINEGLHHGLMVISEKPCESDMHSMEMYSEIVEFIDVIDVVNDTTMKILCEKIDHMLKSYDVEIKTYQERLKNKLQSLSNLFEANCLQVFDVLL